MTRQAHARLQNELAALRSHPNIEVPDDFMDYDDNLVANYTARRARIRQIQDLLSNAVVGEDPPDDGVAEPGMVLTVATTTPARSTHSCSVCVASKTPTSTCTRCNHRWAPRSPEHAPANSAPTPSPVGPTCP